MLTDLGIKKLPLPDKRREVPDGKVSGLYLVLQPSGARSWALRYRVAGKPTKLTIGPYPAIDLAAARKRALEALGDVAGGKDPAAEKQASRAALKAAREAETDRVEKVVDLFVERHAKPKTRDWRETERILIKEVVGRWSGRRLSQITRAHVHEMLDEIIDRGAPIRANRVFAQFRKMCRWAVERGIIDRSPCDGMRPPSPETPRDHVLSDDEIKLVWAACEQIGWPFGPIGKLLLLTGARRDEVAGMTWAELNLDARTWTLPSSRTKNKREHVVPLSDTAVNILKALPRNEGKAGLVFTTTGRTPVSGFSKAKVEIDAAIVKLAGKPMPDWIFHDIRRTVATGLQKLNVKLEVTEAVLNHVSGSRAGIVGVYQRHEYRDEKRASLNAWARKLNEIVTGEKPGVADIAKARATRRAKAAG
jgi:integrase